MFDSINGADDGDGGYDIHSIVLGILWNTLRVDLIGTLEICSSKRPRRLRDCQSR